jgi:hypothetical protein
VGKSIATVWASFNGEVEGFANFGDVDETPKGGWSHVHNFSAFNELPGSLPVRESGL